MKHGPRKTLAEYAVDANAATERECPNCGCRDLRLVQSNRAGGEIARTKECRHCGRRITTSEPERCEE